MTGNGTRPSTSSGVHPAHRAKSSSAGWAKRLRLCTHSTAWERRTAASAPSPAGTVRAAPSAQPAQASSPANPVARGGRASGARAPMIGGPAAEAAGGASPVTGAGTSTTSPERTKASTEGLGQASSSISPTPEHRERPALHQHAAEPVQERAGVALLGLDVDRLEAVDRVHERRQVELGEVGPGEPAVAVGRPLHRGAHRVAVARGRCCRPSAARRRSR